MPNTMTSTNGITARIKPTACGFRNAVENIRTSIGFVSEIEIIIGIGATSIPMLNLGSR
jgi:hypothetical protein